MKLTVDTNVLRDAVEPHRPADQDTLYRALARGIREAELMATKQPKFRPTPGQ